jgi:protein SCO1/2
VTFGYTTCQGACPQTLEKCVSALGRLKPADSSHISPFFVSLDVERDDAAKLRDYARAHHLSPAWRELLDTRLAAAHAFGARRLVSRRADGSIYLTHSTTIYLIDRSMKIRAAFGDEDTAETMSVRMEKVLNSPPALAHSTTMEGSADPRSPLARRGGGEEKRRMADGRVQSPVWHPPA